jgi:hypothetical protein
MTALPIRQIPSRKDGEIRLENGGGSRRFKNAPVTEKLLKMTKERG